MRTLLAAAASITGQTNNSLTLLCSRTNIKNQTQQEYRSDDDIGELCWCAVVESSGGMMISAGGFLASSWLTRVTAESESGAGWGICAWREQSLLRRIPAAHHFNNLSASVSRAATVGAELEKWWAASTVETERMIGTTSLPATPATAGHHCYHDTNTVLTQHSQYHSINNTSVHMQFHNTAHVLLNFTITARVSGVGDAWCVGDWWVDTGHQWRHWSSSDNKDERHPPPSSSHHHHNTLTRGQEIFQDHTKLCNMSFYVHQELTSSTEDLCKILNVRRWLSWKYSLLCYHDWLLSRVSYSGPTVWWISRWAESCWLRSQLNTGDNIDWISLRERA